MVQKYHLRYVVFSLNNSLVCFKMHIKIFTKKSYSNTSGRHYLKDTDLKNNLKKLIMVKKRYYITSKCCQNKNLVPPSMYNLQGCHIEQVKVIGQMDKPN